MTKPAPSPPPRMFYTFHETFEALHCGVTKGYEILKKHNVQVKKVGATPLVPVAELERLVAELPTGIDSQLLSEGRAVKARKRLAALESAEGAARKRRARPTSAPSEFAKP